MRSWSVKGGRGGGEGARGLKDREGSDGHIIPSFENLKQKILVKAGEKGDDERGGGWG